MKKPICPICLNGMEFFEKKSDINGNIVDIFICPYCFLIFNGKSKNNDIKLQEEGLRNIYTFKEKSFVLNELEKYKKHISGLLNLISFNPDNKVFFELGFGSGFTLYAARDLGFNKVFGVDLTTDLHENLKEYFSSDRIEVFTDIENIKDKIDFIYMWHVLEHLDKPQDIFKKIMKISSSNCKIFIQVPQYNKNHLFDAHHFFYTEKSIKLLFDLYGFYVEKIIYDTDNEFMAIYGLRKEKVL